jgi:protein-S-isoprenylcysteine O-methyltransferase Ste14
MAYIDEMKTQGNRLFRWRSFLPVIIMALFFPIGLRNSTYLMGSPLIDEIWEFCCFAIALLGLGIRIYTVGYVADGTSGRTTSKPKAAELNTTGIYSIVRHPLYLGNCIVWAGIALIPHSALTVMSCSLAFFLYYERIFIAEEAFLSEKFGDTFAQWAKKTPAMIPKPGLWVKPARNFSWQAVFKREYPGVLTITASFALIDALVDWYRDSKWQPDLTWLGIFCAGLLVFLAGWILRKMRVIGNPENRSAKQPLGT